MGRTGRRHAGLIVIFVALILIAMALLGTGHAATPSPAASATPLIQCDVGMALPLLLAGLAAVGGHIMNKK